MFATVTYTSENINYPETRTVDSVTIRQILTGLKTHKMLEKISVLILDDEANSTEEIFEFLQKEGYTVFSANSAKAGQSIIKREKVDVIILDLYLPDANGLDFLGKIKAEYPNIEVIMISGQGDVDSIIRSIRLGVVDFLRKPLRQIDLSSALARTKKIQQSYRIITWHEKKQLSHSSELELSQKHAS